MADEKQKTENGRGTTPSTGLVEVLIEGSEGGDLIIAPRRCNGSLGKDWVRPTDVHPTVVTLAKIDAMAAELADAKARLSAAESEVGRTADRDRLFAKLQEAEKARDQAREDFFEKGRELGAFVNRMGSLLGARADETTVMAARRVMRERSIRVRLRDAVRAAREAWRWNDAT